MKNIQYFGVDICKRLAFPYIYAELIDSEPAPNYELDESGMADLGKVLYMVTVDDYYSSFSEKAAYLITSIAGSQYFKNGNKRLALVVLLLFLMGNKVSVITNKDILQKILKDAFPMHVWEEIDNLPVATSFAHSLFLYNLTLVIGDRKKWPTQNFNDMKERVAGIFDKTYFYHE